jgi:hypothetical protein
MSARVPLLVLATAVVNGAEDIVVSIKNSADRSI